MNQNIQRLLNNQAGNYIFPFLWLHGEKEEVLRRYMQVIHESNIGAVCVESRPHPDFCGEQWWHDMDIILDEARKRNMKVWILDDSHFPTGFANGAMKEQPDELCRQSLCCRIYELNGNDELHIEKEKLLHPDGFEKSKIETYIMEKEPRSFDDDSLLGLYAVRMDGNGEGFRDKSRRVNLMQYIREDELEWRIPAGNWKVYAIHRSRNHGYHRSYINMMNRASCKVLLDAVYEPHYAHYKEDFGTTIAGFFSDEPELGNGHIYETEDGFGTATDYPWSEELERRMQAVLKEDCGALLALLWETGADPELTARVRYLYMDAVTRLVREDFSEQVGAWCRSHGVEYIGHLIEDDNHHSRTGSSLGHYFRGLAGQDMAGIDDIGGQVFPQGEDISYNQGVFQRRNGEFYHYMLGKLGSSAAAIEPMKKGNSMCEIFGNYGWSEGVRLEKYLADHFLVRGINHFVPHAFSPKEFPDPDCPPHFYAHGHNPQYRHFGCLMAYMNRVCELMSGGCAAVPTAVLYDAEGDWTGNYMTADKVGHLLADAQIEYEVIPQDVFLDREEYNTSITEGVLRIHTQRYRCLLVPYLEYVTKAFAGAVCEMGRAGIPVVFVGGFPKGICDWGMEPEEREQTLPQIKAAAKTLELENVVEYLKTEQIPEITLQPGNNRIRYRRYRQQDGSEVFLFVNEGTETYCGNARIPNVDGAYIYRYDAWDNQIAPAVVKDGRIDLEIEPLKSRIFVADKSASPEEAEKLFVPEICISDDMEILELEDTWTRSICKGIAYPQFGTAKETTLPDNLEEEKPEFSGFIRYENTFSLEKKEKVYLEIRDAYEGVEVFLNDVSLGIQIVPVYRYDLSSAVKDGRNYLRIEVATTLERAMAKIPNIYGQIAASNVFSGIKSEVMLWKAVTE